MENEELVYSFMEISNLPLEDAKQFLEQSNGNLELALQNYYDSQQSTSSAASIPTPPQSQSQPSSQIQEVEEEVREPIPRQFDIMVQDDVRNVRLSRMHNLQQFSSSFRDFRREMEIQEELANGGGSQPKRKCIEDLYRHPLYISNVNFTFAKLQGQKFGKWIAVLINDESLESLAFNRDIFNTQKAKNVITRSFIFLRKNCNDHEGVRIRQIYNLLDSAIPIFLLIDSLTGELKKNFGDCTKLTLASVVRELKKYSSSTDKQLVYVSY